MSQTAAKPDETADDARAEAELVGEHRPWVTNLILLAIVASLTLWIALGEDQLKTTAELTKDKQKVFKFFKPFDVIALEVHKGDRLIALTRDPKGDEEAMAKPGPGTPAGWEFALPQARIKGRADDAVLMRLLNRMKLEKYSVKVPEAQAGEYDFGAALVTIGLRKKDNTTTIFSVGKEQAGGVYPLRFRDSKTSDLVGPIYHVGKAFGELALQDLNAYRAKELFEVPKGKLTKLLIERFTKAGDLEGLSLAYQDAHWRIDGDYADSARAEELIEGTRTLRAHAIHLDKPDEAQLKALGLFPPQLRLTLTDAEGTDHVLQIGAKVKEDFPQGQLGRYARLQSRPAVVYRVATVHLAELLAPRDDWLTHHRQAMASELLFPISGGLEAVSGLGGKFERGVAYRLRFEEGAWRFELGEEVVAEKAAVEARIKALLELKIGERLGATVDRTARGLVDPLARIELVEGRGRQTYRYEVHVGRGQDGKLSAQRLLEGGKYRVYRVAGLEGVVADLRNGHLDLLDKVVFTASHWDARKIRLERKGQTRFEAVFANPNPEVPRTPKQWSITAPPSPDADPEDIKAFMKTFDGLAASKYVARSAGADLSAYGLDEANRQTLTIWVHTFESGKPVEKPRRLFVGSRVGNLVYVLEEGGAAIALVDAGWLDRLEAGFGKQVTLFEVDLWEAKRLVIEKAGAVVLDAKKPGNNWIRAGSHDNDVEDLLEKLEEVQLGAAEPATPERLEATGLDAPAWTIRITTEEGEAKTRVTRTFLIGKPRGAKQRWAMLKGGDQLGLWFDDALRAIEAHLKRIEAEEAPFPPIKQGE